MKKFTLLERLECTVRLISISIWMLFLQGQCLISMAKKLWGQFHIRKPEAEIAGLSQKGMNLSNMFLADARWMECGQFTSHWMGKDSSTAELLKSWLRINWSSTSWKHWYRGVNSGWRLNWVCRGSEDSSDSSACYCLHSWHHFAAHIPCWASFCFKTLSWWHQTLGRPYGCAC